MVVSKQLSPWIVASILCVTACLDGPSQRPSSSHTADSNRQVVVQESDPAARTSQEESTASTSGGDTRSQGSPAGPGGTAESDESNPLSIHTSYCEAAGCPLRIHFGRRMLTDKDGAKLPALTFDPVQKGTLDWEDDKTLRFTPASGSFNWGHSITAVLEGADAADGTVLTEPWVHSFTVPFFGVGHKMALWPVQPGQPRFVGIMRGTAGALIGAAPLLLLYDQPVKPAELQNFIAVRGEDEKPIPITISRPKSATRFGYPNLDPAHLIALKLSEKVSDGTILALKVPTWQQAGKWTKRSVEVEVATRFEVREVELPEGWDRERAPLNFQFSLSFSTPVSAEKLKQALEISPRADLEGLL